MLQKNQKLSEEKFRHVSIITALNAHHDKINELAAARLCIGYQYATGNIYSIDKWKTQDNDNDKQKGFKKTIDPLRPSDNVVKVHTRKTMEFTTWKYRAPSRHINNCVKEWPVMIKRNEATECCVTNGAEAIVVGWKQSYDYY